MRVMTKSCENKSYLVYQGGDYCNTHGGTKVTTTEEKYEMFMKNF